MVPKFLLRFNNFYLEHHQWYTENYLTLGKRDKKHLNIALFVVKFIVHTLYFLFIPSSPSYPLRLLGQTFDKILSYTFHEEV
jgi:hypothetical protein